MTKENLYAVLKKNNKSKEYVPLAHNLTVENAEAKVNELGAQHTAAYIMLQTNFHESQQVEACNCCQTATQNFSEQDRKLPFGKNSEKPRKG